jgi:hypothetical protein
MAYYTRTSAPARPAVVPGLLSLIWIGVGLVVAATHHYFQNADTWQRIVSAALAVVLWPLVLLGIDLQIHVH